MDSVRGTASSTDRFSTYVLVSRSMEMSEEIIGQSGYSGEALYTIIFAALSKRRGMEPDDLLCSRNALGLVCLVGRSFWSIWFFRMNFQCDQPDKPDRRDRPDEPAFVGRAQWKINQPPSLEGRMTQLGKMGRESSPASFLLAERAR